VLSLSQTTGYAILALACLEEVQGHWAKVGAISECTGIPMPYLSKLLHHLRQAGIVVAKRGTFGGYALAAPAQDTSLLQVAEAVERESWMPKCLLGLAECSDERACPVHDFWSKERARIGTKLAKITIKDAARFERRRRDRLRSCCEPPETPRERR
jgi:Rrf2 family protein